MRFLLAALAAGTALGAPTFTKDVAPILFDNCMSCHREGEAAPFPLTTYEEAKKRGQLIAVVTEARYMPPWHAAKGDAEFRDERRLTAARMLSFYAIPTAAACRTRLSKSPTMLKICSIAKSAFTPTTMAN